jgi:nitrogenase-associated protein
MSDIVFYEKPGCATNARQRQMLVSAGHRVTVRNVLTEPWTDARLLGFFGELPVPNWFNPTAPAVKSGLVDPAGMEAAPALAAMVADPLLIRRPLLEIDGAKCAGFDIARLGLPPEAAKGRDPQACSHPGKQKCEERVE